MVAPWSKFAVRAALWYQGEVANGTMLPPATLTPSPPRVITLRA